MNKMKNNYSRLKEKAERKAKEREKKKRPKMEVSGKSVFKLKEAIGRKK